MEHRCPYFAKDESEAALAAESGSPPDARRRIIWASITACRRGNPQTLALTRKKASTMRVQSRLFDAPKSLCKRKD
jgi:hypothetical protein